MASRINVDKVHAVTTLEPLESLTDPLSVELAGLIFSCVVVAISSVTVVLSAYVKTIAIKTNAITKINLEFIVDRFFCLLLIVVEC